jgi:hypothetical protein
MLGWLLIFLAVAVFGLQWCLSFDVLISSFHCSRQLVQRHTYLESGSAHGGYQVGDSIGRLL